MVAFDAVCRADQRMLANVEGLASRATRRAELDVSEFEGWIGSDDRHLEVLRDAAVAAMGTLDQRKVRALADVLTDAIRDEAKLDTDQLVIRAINDLEVTHIRVLRAMIYDDNPHDSTVVGRRPGSTIILGAQRWSWRDLYDHLPNLGHGLINILATLQRHGLIHLQERETYFPTGFAVTCLGFLGEYAGATSPEVTPADDE
jgi:hypothetical protein